MFTMSYFQKKHGDKDLPLTGTFKRSIGGSASRSDLDV